MRGTWRAGTWAVASAAAAVAITSVLALSGPVSATGIDPSTSPTPSETATLGPTPSPTSSDSASDPSTGTPPATATPPSASPAAASASPTPSASATPLEAPTPFIITMDSDSEAAVLRAIKELGGQITGTYDYAISGVAARLTPSAAKALAATPGVNLVEPDLTVSIADASALSTDAGCALNSLTSGDDVSSSAIDLGFTANWNGRTYDKVLINSNGAIAFDDGLGPFRDYVIDLSSTNRPVISIVGTDLDSTYSGAVTYGVLTAPFGGKPGFCVQWSNVAEFGASTRKVTAQLLILNAGSGNVALVMNYSTIDAAFSRRIEIGYAEPDTGTRARMLGSATSPSPFRDGGGSARNINGNTTTNLGNPTAAGRFFYLYGASAQPLESDGGSGPGSTWGLDRIDQRDLPLDSQFTPAGIGAGVTAYVVDTGILTAHSDFTGRTSTSSGYDAVDGALPATDCNGHGTHVAGTIGGTTFGVARSATLVPIRVLNCAGSGTTSSVIAGIDWAIADHASGPAVMNLSLGGVKSLALNEAIARAVADNITVVVAAGNSSADACNFSPASEPTAITVGATTVTDAMAYFSNFGSCLDIFAPGVDITSDWYSSSTATRTISGTSMASPHVAGAAAVYLGLNPTATPAEVTSALQSAATPNKVTGASGSSNRLLYVRSFTAAPAAAAAPAVSSGGVSSGGGASGGGGALQAITEVRPAVGPLSGGNQVSIIGYGFTGATRVEVGGKSVPFTVVNDAHVQVTMPPGDKVGSADVAVVLTPARGRAFAPGGYVYQENVAVPAAPTAPGQVGILTPAASTGTVSATLPPRLAISGRVAYTQSSSGVGTVRVTVPRTAAGRTASLLRKGKVVAKTIVPATGVVTFRGRALTPGAYRMSITDGRMTTAVTTPIVLRTPTRSR